MEHKTNKKVEKAGFSYCGHYDVSELVICFNDCCVKINPSQKHLQNLFAIFDIDSEDKAYFNDITGKYCVVIDNGNKIVALEHLTKNIRWDIKQ